MFPGLPYNTATNESRDGKGAADHDKPYEWNHRPRLDAPWPFTWHQYELLLIQRSRLEGFNRRSARRPPRQEAA